MIKSWEESWSEIEEAHLLLEMAVEESDPEAEAEVADNLVVIEKEIDQTISAEKAFEEAGRCMSCGLCFDCQQCFMYCTSGCFTRSDDPEPGGYFTLNLDACRQCGKCIEVCPCGFLEPA